MASAELELISNIIKTGDFSAIRKKNVTPQTFQTEEARVVFQWLWDQYHLPDSHGLVPDKSRFDRKFPDFHYCPTRDSIESLISEVVADKNRAEIRRLSADMEEYLEDDNYDPREVLSNFMPAFREVNVSSAEEDGLVMSKSVEILRQEYETRKVAGGVTGIPYPWEILNHALGGMHPEEWIVLYARMKNGKTWLALKMAVEAYLNNYRVLVYSKEMAKEQMLRRSASIIAGADYELVRTGSLPEDKEEEFFSCLSYLSQWEEETQEDGRRRSLCIISDHGRKEGSTVDSLAARAERFEPDLILVDGFYLMRDGRTNVRSTDWKQIAHISQDLKALAQQMRIPIIGTTQANRNANKSQGEDLDEISFADAIGMDCDVAMRSFLGKAPDGKSAAVLTFPGVREAKLNPFMLSFNPGSDFSMLSANVDMDTFLKEKKRMEKEDHGKPQKGGNKQAPPPGAGRLRL